MKMDVSLSFHFSVLICNLIRRILRAFLQLLKFGIFNIECIYGACKIDERRSNKIIEL